MKRSPSTSRCGRASWSSAAWTRRIAREIVLARLGDARSAQTHVRGPGQKARTRDATDTVARRAQRRCALRAPSIEGVAGFTLVAAVTLALGIGANSAMFALADATLLRPLRFPSPIVSSWSVGVRDAAASGGVPSTRSIWSTGPTLRVDGGNAAAWAGGSIAGDDGGRRKRFPPRVTARFFDVLGVTPIAGRTFRADEDEGPTSSS